MICPLNFRPFLKIGRYQVAQYDDMWIRDALISAGEAADCEVEPLADDLIAGVSHYLENRCHLEVLEVETLLSRISKMLAQVGMESVADQLAAAAPPVTIDLEEIAQENAFELAFFTALRRDIEDLRERGVHELHFTGTRVAVQNLLGRKRWTIRCKRLLDELESFLVAIPSSLKHSAAAAQL